MYFLAQEKVKAQFLHSGFSDRQAMPYFMVFIGLSSLACIPLITNPSSWDYICAITSFIFALLGTFALYRANGGSRGTQFIQKYIILGFVLVVRALIVVIPLVFILLGIGIYFSLVDLDVFGPYDTASLFLIEILVWLYLYKHFRSLRKRECAEQGAAVNP